MSKKNVGFLVNPIAGCGQFFNMKGSDGLSLKDCPESVSLSLAERFLDLIPETNVTYYTASGNMGAKAFNKKPLENFHVIYNAPEITSRADTQNFVCALGDYPIDILVFFGGDGTAKDLVDARVDIPVLGVPAGTKMFSSVFSISVEDAVSVLRSLLSQDEGTIVSGDVIYVDENKYSAGNLVMSLYGQLKIPSSPMIVTACKGEYPDSNIMDIVEYIEEIIKQDVNYIVGPGSTCLEIKKLYGDDGTTFGFDLIKNGKIVARDLSEKEIYEAEADPTKIVISPLGGQGFLIGRGNKQLSARVIKKIGFENFIVVSSPEKLNGINYLYIDIGNFDFTIPSYVRVLYGYGTFKLVKLRR
ncbi:MAG: ATP-NAD kinase family protein [Thermoplasmatales archaeon]|nr:ATP-NAD kinase family protein [Thermoplasmatales archaeon]MCW6170881.1 ATP-NAD kinase family protein [Thermoplasmatales archaeon]